MKRILPFLAVLAFLFGTQGDLRARAETPVDVELVLAVDVSSSMMSDELALQRQGYAAAFRSDEVLRAIRYNRYGRIAVTYVEWGASDLHDVIVPWTAVATAEDAERIAVILESARVRNLARTSISGAIRYSVRAFADNRFQGTRRVIDVSGDGPNNQGGLVTEARDAAIGEGITINGLPVVIEGRAFGEETIADLDDYYADCVIGGPQAFVMAVKDWNQFAEAVRRKLVVELSGGQPPVWRASSVVAEPAGGQFDCGVGEAGWKEMGGN
ncbi:MAG: DUF1194 domain-containing protein [Rhizobiaceae bacterium]